MVIGVVGVGCGCFDGGVAVAEGCKVGWAVGAGAVGGWTDAGAPGPRRPATTLARSAVPSGPGSPPAVTVTSTAGPADVGKAIPYP